MSFWGNHTCPHETAEEDPIPFYANGSFTFKAHHLGWTVAGFFALISTAVSLWLIFKHLTYFTNRTQQRQIIRILLMVPIYAVASFLSYLFRHQAVYFHVVRDCYEAFVIASFFYLVLAYLGEDDQAQCAVLRRVELKKWMWPLGSVKARPASGLYFLQLMKWGVCQYVVLRPLTTLAACILQYFGLYCDVSYAPYYGYLYDLVIVSISVTIALYCLMQLAVVVLDELKPHRPIMKFLCVKSVVFLMFWQSSCLGLLFSFGWVKPTRYWSAVDLQTGILALLETFEMCIFAFLHVKAFTYRVYRPDDRSLKTSQWKAFVHVLNHQDLLHEIAAGSSYLWAKMRGREPDATRDDDLEHLTGARRDEGPPGKAERLKGDGAEKKAFRDDPSDIDLLPALHQRQRLMQSRPQASARASQISEEDEYSPAPLGRVDRLRARYESLSVDEPEASRDPRLSPEGWSVLPSNPASQQFPPNLTDLPRLRMPRGPNAIVIQPIDDSYRSIRNSRGNSERGTFGLRHSSSTGSVDGHLREASADSFQTAQSRLAHDSPALRSVQQHAARLSLDGSLPSGVVPFIGLPRGAHLPSAGGVVRPVAQHARPVAQHAGSASRLSLSATSDLLERDSRFPRFVAPPNPYSLPNTHRYSYNHL